ncbi:MAG: hypothetical protein DRN30_03755, partial [Thermoplasmata archaeon]
MTRLGNLPEFNVGSPTDSTNNLYNAPNERLGGSIDPRDYYIAQPTPQEDSYGLSDAAQDVGVGLLEAGAQFVDTANEVAGLATLGASSKAADQAYDATSAYLQESTGYSLPTLESIQSLYSDKTQEQRKEIAGTDGFINSVKAIPDNPLAVASYITSSLGPMGLSAVFSRGLKRLTGKAMSSVGEGAVIAGSVAGNIRGENSDSLLQAKDLPFALGAGVGGGLIGLAGKGLANKFDVADIDSILGGGVLSKQVVGGAVAALKSGSIEGIEELGQEGLETVMLNAALDKPLTQGLGNAMAIGLVTGGVMGAGGSAFSGGFSKNDKNKVINPDTGTEFKDSDVKHSVEVLGNLHTMRDSAIKAGRDTADLDAKIKENASALKNLKEEDNTKKNTEVDSALKMLSTNTAIKAANEKIINAVNTQSKVEARVEIANPGTFTPAQSARISKNIIDKHVANGEEVGDTRTDDLINAEIELAKADPEYFTEKKVDNTQGTPDTFKEESFEDEMSDEELQAVLAESSTNSFEDVEEEQEAITPEATIAQVPEATIAQVPEASLEEQAKIYEDQEVSPEQEAQMLSTFSNEDLLSEQYKLDKEGSSFSYEAISNEIENRKTAERGRRAEDVGELSRRQATAQEEKRVEEAKARSAKKKTPSKKKVADKATTKVASE